MKRTLKPNQLYDKGTNTRRDSEEQEKFKSAVLQVSEQAFRKFADCHVGASTELKELECQRFLKILKNLL